MEKKMLIDGYCSEEDEKRDFIFKVTNETKKFIISFFGFYPHSLAEDFHLFLESLEVQEIIGSSFDQSLMSCDYSLDGDFGYECYNMSDRRTFDVGIVLQKTFVSEDAANKWFNDKIKNSDDIRLKDISEILVIDGDKFIAYLDDSIEEDNRYEEISNSLDADMIAIKKTFNDSVRRLQNDLLLKFTSDIDKKTIKELVDNVLEE
jgi:hypothetical protein